MGALAAVLQSAGAQDAGDCAGRAPTITGTDGPDTLTGTNGADVIAAGAGDDVVSGLDQNDFICGGAGDDRFIVDRDNDMIDGEGGTDTISFADAVSASVDLGVRGAHGVATATGTETLGTDRLERIENVQGSPGPDVLAGGPAVNRLDAAAGNDTFVYFPADQGDDTWLGGPGADTAEFERAPGPTTVDLALGSAAVTGAGTGTERFEAIEHVNGSFFNDTLKGDGAANHFSGNSDNLFTGKLVQKGLTADADRLEGGGGEDRLHTSVGPSILEGGDGNDYLRAFPQSPVTMAGGPGNDDLASGADPGVTTPYSADSTYTGGPGSDSLYGTNANDTLNGDEDNDTLVALAGDDTLVGGAGDADSGNGGAGSDTCDASIESPSECAHGGTADGNTAQPAYTATEANISVTLAPSEDDIEGDYVVKVSNRSGYAVTDVRVRVFYAGVVRQDSLAPECSLGTGFATTAEVVCHIASLPAAGAGEKVLPVAGDETEDHPPTHMAVAYLAPSSYASGPPKELVWDDNVSVFKHNPVVVVTGIEVTQGLQNVRGDVPLVEGRKTWVRVHVRAAAEPGAPGVRAELHALDPVTNRSRVFRARTPTGSPTGTLAIPTIPNRTSDSEVFRFELPPDWWKGNILFQVKIPTHAHACADPTRDCRIPVQFHPGPSIDLQLVSIPWTDQRGVIHAPTAADMTVAALQVQAVFPVVNVRSRWTHNLTPSWLPKGPPAKSDFWMEALHRLVIADRWLTGCKPPLSDRCYEVGLLVDPPSGNGLLGLSLLDADQVLAYLEEEFTLPHELGHAAGREHTRCTGDEAEPDLTYPYPGGHIGIGAEHLAASPDAYWGTDMYNTRPQLGAQPRTYYPAFGAFDLMTYCGPRWIGRTTHAAIRRVLQQRFGSPPASARAAARQPALLVSGVIGPGRRADEIFAVDELRTAPTRTRRGTHSVRMFSRSGKLLARAAFTPERTEGSRYGAFAVALPAARRVGRVVLFKGRRRLDVVRPSRHDPKVDVVRPRRGARLKRKYVGVAWRASDPDGGRLTFSVEYSANNGRTWTPVTREITVQRIRIARSRLRASRRARFRITANDGFRSAAGVSGRFSLRR